MGLDMPPKVVDVIERAHRTYGMFCQSYWMGPNMPPNTLSMILNGPAAFMKSFTNYIGWAPTCR